MTTRRRFTAGFKAKVALDALRGDRTVQEITAKHYRHELTDGFKAERVIRDWIEFYNTERPHSALADRTPAEAYGVNRPVDMMDKADALPTSPQAQQQQKNLINEILAA
jgi:transposase InsO family protein